LRNSEADGQGDVSSEMPFKVVKATYIIEQTFVVPSGVDISADGVTWNVKLNKLDIFKDGKKVAEGIEPTWDASSFPGYDWKCPDKVEIADDYDTDDEDDVTGERETSASPVCVVDKSKAKTMSPEDIKEIRAELKAHVKEHGLTPEIVKTRSVLNRRMAQLNKQMAALKVQLEAATLDESEATETKR